MAVEDVLARARVLADLGRDAEAEPLLAQALAQDPDNEDGLTSMARVKCLLGRKPEGVPFARRAVELHPDQVTALTTLADVLQQVTHGSAEALELLHLDLPDASRLLHPCLLIAVRIMTEHFVSMVGTLEEILEEGGEPSADFLAEGAHWLDLLVRTLTLGVTGHRETARKALRALPEAVAFLRQVPAAPGSEFAGAV